MIRRLPAIEPQSLEQDYEQSPAHHGAHHGQEVDEPAADPAPDSDTAWPYASGRRPGGGTRMAINAICIWSLLEAPLELGMDSSTGNVVGLVAAKTMVLSIGFAARSRMRFARLAFALLCGASVLAIVPSLPLMYKYTPLISLVSAIECALKALYLIAFCRVTGRVARRGRAGDGVAS
jgi:hypothetical protein